MIAAEHRVVARQFGKDFFDGDRLYGYGGFGYHPRFWTETVAQFKEHYGLTDDVSILDVGCAKGYMLHDFGLLMPDATLKGIDISEYAIENAIDDMKVNVEVADAMDLPFEDDSFDLVIAINSIHNLPLEDCKTSVRELQRVAKKHAFLTVDAWRNDEQEVRMKNWNLTGLTMMHVDDWEVLFAECGYTYDYFWFIP
ncbi:MAG: class I SAM-dependent methyltransferase [Chloroflexi bacterium]|nr:class I SAM-dependent methyltransferase [Chloroflexota bacterium]